MMQILQILMIVLPLVLLVLSGAAFRRTTLLSAWMWALAASTAFAMTATCYVLDMASAAASAAAWYAVAVLGLCPLIAVLGARRPGAAAWNWFVVLPLIAVLLWPLATALLKTPAESARIDLPPFLGFLLALAMACGNYLGTRFWLPTALYAVGEFLLAAPVTEWENDALGSPPVRLAAFGCWAGAVAIAWLIGRRSPPVRNRFDQIWLAFRNAYGIVWAVRVLQRVNERAQQEDWAARLHSSGFAWDPDADSERRAQTEQRIEHTLRWLLRRFVDDVWLDEALRNHPGS